MTKHTNIDRPYAEEHIWLPIERNPALIGYANALALHQVQVGNQSGYVDLVLLPPNSDTKIVLVEAKRVEDSRASADVIGQLLKYYAHALQLTSNSVERYRHFATHSAKHGRPSRLISLRTVFGATSLQAAQDEASQGEKLTPNNIALVIALDAYAPKLASRLIEAAKALHNHHQIPLSVIVVRESEAHWLFPNSTE
jgi:hypothetical protein